MNYTLCLKRGDVEKERERIQKSCYYTPMNPLLVGMDEVGRGPLAGPVVVGAIVWKSVKDPNILLKGIKDSKKLTESQREDWFVKIKNLELEGILNYEVTDISPEEIDDNGIKIALKKATYIALKTLKIDYKCKILCDYGLPISSQYNSTHIIKGDEKEPIIAAASIVAKVRRDWLMKEYSKKYPLYNFEKNKGYGTKAHRKAIETHGYSPIHRVTFLRNIKVAK